MESVNDIKAPTKRQRLAALESYTRLSSSLNNINRDSVVIEIEETQDKVKLPLKIMQLLASILKETSEGRSISIVPVEAEMTTQAAAEFLGCSRPYIVKLLEKGEIEFTKIGKHRRVKYHDILRYQKKQKYKQRQLLSEIMAEDESSGLYDS